MPHAEEQGEDDGRGPEAQGCAVAGLEGPLVNTCEPAAERVQDIAARQVLLEQPDQEKPEQPDGSVTENVAAKHQAAVKDQESALPEGQDEQRETDNSPGHASEEVLEHATVAEAINRVGTALDLGHDPGDENSNKERNQLGDETEARRYLGWGVRLWRGWIELVPDTVRAERYGREDSDEDQQAPASAQSVLADEYLVESRRLRRFGGDQRCIIGRLADSLIVQGFPRVAESIYAAENPPVQS